MTTPILTKKEQRQSLSAKKGPIKGLRNILAQPFETFWPLVNVDEFPTLVTLMNELLPLIKRPTFTIPGSMLRHMSKEERRLARKEALEKQTIKPDINMLKSMIVGINAVTRTLEKDKVCCILLDANVEPSLLIKHIVLMAQNKKIPVLLLPILKTITLQTIGFATAALALKRDVMQSSNNGFHQLYKLVTEVFKSFKPLKCSAQLFKPNEIPEETVMHEMEITNTICDSTPDISKEKKANTISTDVYKYRSSRQERTFIPSASNSQDFKTSSDEFIALNNECGPGNDKNFTLVLKDTRYVNISREEKNAIQNSEKDNADVSFNESKLNDNGMHSSKHTENSMLKKRKYDITYLPLKVKRIQGNSNRIKATKFTKKKKKS